MSLHITKTVADEPARQAVLAIDKHLADAGFGVYIIVTGRKE